MRCPHCGHENPEKAKFYLERLEQVRAKRAL